MLDIAAKKMEILDKIDEYRELFKALRHVKKRFPEVYARYDFNIDSALKWAESRLSGDVPQLSLDDGMNASFGGDNDLCNTWVHLHDETYIYFNSSKSMLVTMSSTLTSFCTNYRVENAFKSLYLNGNLTVNTVFSFLDGEPLLQNIYLELGNIKMLFDPHGRNIWVRSTAEEEEKED